ncbi:AraC family transcriptional regulator [Paraburkholderia sp. BCC1884]|uniref:AraC family transcriptional regulator n=1 Tax=Paraburkholderia sp. BCC1884 TaxID=2562668 RepID=UPI0011828BC7|nr:AraC family transcriptional regulator [Paraburkholderia sp. BCC1884]
MDTLSPDDIEQPAFVIGESSERLDEPWQSYRRARLIHVRAGILTVRTGSARWVMPPGHAVWVAANELHCLTAAGAVVLNSLYVDAHALPAPPLQSGAIKVDRLVEALLIAAAEMPHTRPLDEAAARLVQVLLDRLPALPVVSLGLNWPRDPRIARIADALNANPAEPGVLEELAAAAGVTGRTAARLFVKETGQTFGQWRQQLRLLVALERLGLGTSVSQVALEIGYSDVSSFIAVFRDAFGDTPARYFR